MKLLIEDSRLNLLLEQKKQFIGTRVVWDSLLSAVSFLLSVCLASYGTFWLFSGVVWKTIFALVGIFFTCKAAWDVLRSLVNNYTFQDLLSDINRLNEITHGHSIVVVKDTFRDYPNRYLVYEDKRWSCDFFLNYKENPNNEDFIKEHLSNELKIRTTDISLSYKGQKVHEKFSESAGERKVYSHRFYLATVQNFPEAMMRDSFTCDDRSYRWRTMPDLEQDAEIQKKNLDVLNFVKELF